MRTTFRTFLPLLLTAPLFCQGEVDLRTTAKKGGSVWLLQEMKMDQTIDMGGQQMETGQHVTRTVHVAVKDADDKGLTVVIKLARVQGTIIMPMGMGDSEFDSATPDAGGDDDADPTGGMASMVKKSMLAGVGKSFTAKVGPNGKVVELVDTKDILDGNDEGGMMGGSGITEDTLREITEAAFGALPEKPTAPGGKWSTTNEQGGGRMPFTSKLELTLAKVDADAFEITAAGTVEKPAADEKADGKAKEGEEDNPAAEMMKGMKISNGKVTGTEKVSRQDGFVLESSTVMTMDVEMDTQMGSMNMSMKSTKSTKRTTEAAAMAKKADKVEPPKTGADAKKDEPKKEEPKK